MLLFVFYIFIVPVGTIIYLASRIGVKKNTNTYWMADTAKPVDVTSPY